MINSEEDALRRLEVSDLLELGMDAGQLRREKHPQDTVTYALRPPAGLSLQEAATSALTHGHANVSLTAIAGIDDVATAALEAQMLDIRNQQPHLTFHDLPLARLGSSTKPAEELRALQTAGLRSVLLEQSAAASGNLQLHRSLIAAIGSLGLGLRAALTIGQRESLEQRVHALSALRSLQRDSSAFTAVELRVHHATTPDARREEEATAVDYLKTLAITRLFLAEFRHVQTDWSVMGAKVLELALRFGADDAGTVSWSQTGAREPSHHGGESELRRIIRDAGFQPVERDALFRQSLLH
jgi:cyclic dehypoxanthinyl futalosine synthase